jgi:hypothetical protein
VSRRAEDGTSQLRPAPPDKRPRWRWRVIRHRPRLWRFWHVERRSDRDRGWGSLPSRDITFVYVGARDGRETPLLVLVLARARRLRALSVEWTWYPAAGEGRRATRPLLHARHAIWLGRLEVSLTIRIWPAHVYSLIGGWTLAERDG